MDEKIEKIMKEAEYFLLDMDGTIYFDDTLIGDMKNTLSFLRERGKKLIYLTNNSSKSQSVYVEKLKRIGLWNDQDEVYSSGMATAQYLQKFHDGEKVFLLGTPALKKEFEEHGICLVEDEQPDLCVLGYDTGLTYENLCKMTTYLKRGAKYIATHPDINCPAKEESVPDVGSFIELIYTSTGRRPETVIGKPNTVMGDNLMRLTGRNKSAFVMVGDRLYTDIAFGVGCGFHTILVLSGETTREDLEKSDVHPECVLASLNDIVK